MILYDLKCGAGHGFEGWFGSGAAYDDQRARGLLNCPICGSADVGKAAMAPAVPMKGNRGRAEAPSSSEPSLPVASAPDPAVLKQALSALATAQAEVLRNSEWVGRKFADEARAMHYGETDHKPIHGEASPAEARALAEEGVAIAALPLPVVPPEAKN